MINGRWTLERVLGSGATATVYAARDATGTRVALKLLSEEMSTRPDIRERFEREGQAAQTIPHGGVVRVLEHDATDPRNTYLAMELLEGETLAERVSREGSIPTEELLQIVNQVLDVLVVAHAQGVVHRDLKPGNLFLTNAGGVKVLDFGVARVTEPGSKRPGTHLGVTLGTAAYMAPEQAQGRSAEVDGRSDLFSVGAMMFRLVTGRRVHECENEAQLLAAMATQPAPKVATVAPNVPTGIASIIDVALSFSRDARYWEARAMQNDVRAVLAGRPPQNATLSLSSREQETVLAGPVAPPSDPADQLGAPEEDRKTSIEGQVLAERYRIEQLLGSGGMGAVYRGTHIHMRKAVAVKVLHREMTVLPEVVARFEREAVAAARIEHPNVATATDFGRLDDGSFYLVLEYVEGRSLRELLDTERKLPALRALHITAQIVAALSAAHAAGIVHRDLKPDNVMLVERKGDPDFVKVLDFGIAKLSAEDTAGQPALTQIGSVFGTPEYMSPEQAKGEPVDARADLYTVGLLLYEMLTGQTPFQHDDMIAVLTAQMTQPPPPLPADVDPNLSALVMTQLAKEPAERIQTADELLQRLQQMLGYDPLSVPQSVIGSVQVAYHPAVLDPTQPGDSPASSTTGIAATLPDAGGPSAASAGAAVAPVTDPLARLRQRAPTLFRTYPIAGRSVPVWAIGGGAAIVGLVATVAVLLLFTVASEPDSARRGQAQAGEATTSKTDAAQDQLLRQAASGEQKALKTLDARPENQRSLAEWKALGRGHAKAGEIDRSVTAYARALRLDPSLNADQQLQRDLRRALDDPRVQAQALELCKKSLGSVGPDLLHDLWDAHRRDSKTKSYADRAMQVLSEQSVRDQASPALSVALDLQQARGCAAHKKLLPRAAKYADARSDPYLRRLLATKGCGFLGLGDCYSCVRGDPNLRPALDRARATPAPDFAPTSVPKQPAAK